MNVSLKELIGTGLFGAVTFGMSRAQVESLLGGPGLAGGTSRKYRQPLIWKYGDVELHFAAGVGSLFLIHLDDFDVPSGGESVDLDPWVIRRGLTLLEAEGHLSRSGIGYEVAAYKYEDGAECVTAGVGVQLIFAGEERSLRALSYTRPAT